MRAQRLNTHKHTHVQQTQHWTHNVSIFKYDMFRILLIQKAEALGLVENCGKRKAAV